VSLPLTYVLPIRTRDGEDGASDLDRYLAWLSERVDLVIVDGSDAEAFERHRRGWSAFGRHVRPDAAVRCANGKVRGVLTGVRLARNERLVVADDDVRYDDATLRRISSLLDRADLVRPQNHFVPAPWHARWDTARTLVNRALGQDFPGTLGVRRSFLRRVGGYDGDVLFENLELIRTVEAAGGRVIDAPWLYVARRPPTVRRFLEQRPRQAYDDWAQPARFAAFLSVVPALAVAAWRRPATIPIAAGAAVAIAELGRRRNGGAEVFEPSSSLFSPLWIVERGLLSWVALARGTVGRGSPYAGAVIRRAASSPRELARRFRSHVAA
jgi:Glycosyltransferase like family 2